MDVESLKAAFSTNTAWAEYSAIAVFVGLLFDVFVILAFDLRDAEKSRWEIGFAFIGAAIIAAGVFGEWRYGRQATIASTQLQQNSEERIGALNRQAEMLRNENLVLEKALQPRKVVLMMAPDDRFLKPLKQFKGTAVIVDSVPDLEAARLASNIVGLLQTSGWETTSMTEPLATALKIDDGLDIYSPMPARYGGSDMASSVRARSAADALGQYLSIMSEPEETPYSVSFSPKRYPPYPTWWRSDFRPTDAVVIVVGMKPIADEISDVEFLNSLPDKPRRWFEERKGLLPPAAPKLR